MASLLGFLIAKTGYPALNIFTSSVPLSMAGAGYLYSSPISSKMNPSSQSGKSFSASLYHDFLSVNFLYLRSYNSTLSFANCK